MNEEFIKAAQEACQKALDRLEDELDLLQRSVTSNSERRLGTNEWWEMNQQLWQRRLQVLQMMCAVAMPPQANEAEVDRILDEVLGPIDEEDGPHESWGHDEEA